MCSMKILKMLKNRKEDMIMKKTVVLMALAALALSCAKENEAFNDNAQPLHKADFREVTITASPEQVETKTYFDKSTGALTWTTNESNLAVYDGTDLQAFTYEGATDGKASFTGTADVAAASWTAVHPASHAALEGGKVYVTFPCIQEARDAGGLKADMNTVAAQVTHDGSGIIEDCVLKNVGGLLKLTVAKTGIKTITVSSRGGQALTGKAELSFDGSGNPVVTPVTTKYETFVTLKAANRSTGLAAGEYFVSVFPAAMTTGLLIDMENIDGTVASIKTTSTATVNRNSDLEFSGFDTGASWYTPATTTMELKFMNVTWPFVETTATGGTADDAKKWAGNVEKQLTYTPDNSILFYVNCSNYCSANGANGLRMGKGQGDYLLFPALPGKNLTKVEVKYVSGKTDKTMPAIMTRGGSGVVLGGDAITTNIEASADTWKTWNLVGTAHNMQYRYELTFAAANDVTYIEQINLTYASKPSSIAPPTPDPTTTVLDMVFWEGSDYTVDGAVLQPFTTNLPIWNTDTNSDFVLSKGGNNYTFHFYGLQMRLAVHKQWRGLNLNKAGSYIMFPAISGYKLTKVEGVLGGRSYEDYVAASYDPDTPATHGRYGAKQICISTSSNSADSIKDYAIAAASIVNPAVISIELDSTADNTSYYLVTGTDGVCLRNLTITYTEVSSPAPAPAPAPAQLLDGGVTIL